MGDILDALSGPIGSPTLGLVKPRSRPGAPTTLPAPWPRAPCSRVDPPGVERSRDLANGPDERRAPHRQVLLLRQIPHAVERVAQLVRELGPNLLAIPEQPSEILHPLEVRDRDPAGVR